MVLEDGGRSLPVGTATRPQRIRLDDGAFGELLGGGAPQPFLLDLVSGAVCAGESLSELVEMRPTPCCRLTPKATFPVGTQPGT